MTVSRRDFLKACAVASSVPLVGLHGDPAVAAEVPRKGGTLRVGFYIEAATMDPHLSGSKIDRQVYHNIYEPLVTLDNKLGDQARPGRVVDAARSEDARLQAAPRGQVPRRHRLQRRGGQVQLRPDEDRAEVGAQGRDRQHRDRGGGRRVHHQAQPEAAGRGAAGHPHRPRRHDGLAQGRSRSAAPSCSATPGRGHRALRVRRVGEGRPPDHQAQRRLLEQAGRPLPRPDPLPADPRRHRQAPEPAVGRDRRDGLRAAARRGGGEGGQERGRGRRAVAGRLRLPAQPHEAAVQQQGAAPGGGLRDRHRADRQGRVAQRGRAGQRADPAHELGLRQVDPAHQARPRQGEGQAGRGRQAERLQLHADDQQHPDQRPGGRGDPGPARRGRHHHEDQAGRLRHAARRTATARTSR